MEKTLYLECYSGISGDMTVAALLDLGADEQVLRKVLESLPLPGFLVEVSRVAKSGIDACDFNVILETDNHDHDMEYLHGAVHAHGHNHEESERTSPGHHHEHIHAHEQPQEHHHAHAHRGMKEIREIVAAGQMTESARALTMKIFNILAEAEARAHKVPVEEVHFHEVGAVDSIVDIVAVAVCLDNLDIKKVIVPVLCEGRGTIRCQHGILPVPVPAVTNILAAYDLDIQLVDANGEFITPTGAAIVAAVRTSKTLPEKFKIMKTGIGAGKRSYERPGILRAMLIDSNDEISDREKRIVKLESNIDDCSGEVLGYVMEQLFKAGARDVHYMPVFMKKNRPAWLLNVICMEENREALEKIIFRETTTIGIRRMEMDRSILSREQRKIETRYGIAEVKVCRLDGQERFYPEYESVAALAGANKKPYEMVFQEIIKQCEA